MGLGMARNLYRHGYLAAVYNRTPDRQAELPVTVCASPAELAALVNVIFICVSADTDMLEMVEAVADGVRPGAIVVDMSTVSSAAAIRAAALLAERQAVFLDAPVTGGVEGAAGGTLSMMVGGDAAVLDRVRPLLATMATRIAHMGGTGQGQACKAVNQVMAAGINQAVCQALAFAAAQGLDSRQVIDAVTGGAADNWFLQRRGKTMVSGVFQPGFRLALHHKDLLICRQMAQQTGVVCPLIDETLADYAELMTQGYGDEDISALFRLKSRTE